MLPPPAARSALRQLLYVPGPVRPSSRCHAGEYHSLFQTVPHSSVARDYCASASAVDRVSYKQPTCRSTWQRKSAWHSAGSTPTSTWTWPNGAHSPALVLLLLYPSLATRASRAGLRLRSLIYTTGSRYPERSPACRRPARLSAWPLFPGNSQHALPQLRSLAASVGPY